MSLIKKNQEKLVSFIKGSGTSKKLDLSDILMLLVGSTSVSAILLLIAQQYSPQISLASGFLLTALFLLFRRGWEFEKPRIDWVFFGVLLLALFLRLPGFNYISGGQDQGLYMSMSRQIEENGGLYIYDDLRESLTEDQKEKYDLEQSAEMPGISSAGSENKLIIPFYPLHPVWLSISGFLFGDGNRILSLAFFSILGIIGFKKFLELLKLEKGWVYLGSAVLAVNPLLVYFAKFPVSETLAFSLTIWAFYYLARYFFESKTKWHLFLSLLLFNAFFFTRISAFLYLPFFYLLVLLNNIRNKGKLRKEINLFVIVWTILLLLSNVFYSQYLREVFDQIYRVYLLRPFGNSWPLVGVIAAMVALFPISIVKSFRVRNLATSLFNWVYRNRTRVLWLLLLFLVIVSGYNFYKVAYVGFSFQTTGINGIYALKYLGLTTFVLYLTPFAFIAYIIGLFKVFEGKNLLAILIGIFSLLFLIYLFVFYKWTYYHYYYARYYVIEAIPFAIIIALFGFKRLSKQKIVQSSLIFLTLLYLFFFSALLIGKSEEPDLSAYSKLNSYVSEDDLLFVDNSKIPGVNQIITPEKYFFNRNTFTISSITRMWDPEMLELYNDYPRVFILTARLIPNPKRIELIEKIDFRHTYISHCLVEELSFFKLGSSSEKIPYCEFMIIPNREYSGVQELYLYELIHDFD